MTKRSILSLASKIIGLVFLAEAIVAIPSVIQLVMMFWNPGVVNAGNPMPNALLYIGGLFLSFAIASVLIGSSDWIARVLVSEDQEVALPDVKAHGRAILELACRIVGIVLLAQAIPAIVRLFAESALRTAMISAGDYTPREVLGEVAFRVRVEHWSSLFGSGASIAIGLCLIFLAGRLSALLYPATTGADQGDSPNRE